MTYEGFIVTTASKMGAVGFYSLIKCIMKTLKKGSDANSLQLLVDNVDLKPFSQMKSGIIEDGILIKFGRYNLDDLLCQILEDYGEDEIIERIRTLE